MNSICPELNCPRREECKKQPKSHANPHQHDKFCDIGCELQAIHEGGRTRQMSRCVCR